MAGRAGKTQTLNLTSRLGASNDSKTKYGGDGVNYKARFVGSEDVMDSTGSKIAQTTIGRIRAECRAAGGGKPKVLINLSYNGVKVADLKTKIWSISVPIPRVTYVTKDVEDPCVFCIIVARKKAGFKLFVYKAEQRITAQIVQSIRELFQMVYKMVQKNKKIEEAKSKSATTLPKTNSDAAIARITSDSKLLDPPPQYEIDPAYSMVDVPPPQKNKISEVHRSQVSEASKSQTLPPPKNQDGTKIKPQKDDNLADLSTTQPPSQQQNNYDGDITYAVPWAKKKSSVVIPYGYQVPPSNQPALPSNHYQIHSNRPTFPDSTDATKEWSVLDAELAEIAKELNMFGDISSTSEQPTQQQQWKSHKQSSVVDPFQDDFFYQPFNPLQVSFEQTDNSITFESSDPFSSPDLSALSDNIGDMNDDPFTAFEFGNPTNDKPNSDSHKETTIADEQPSEGTEISSIPPDAFGVRLSLDQPPDESKISTTNPFTAGLGATTDKRDNVVARRSWTTFNSTESTEPSKAKKRSSMFEESVSAKQSTNSKLSNASEEQTFSPIKPPPRNRRKSSRPHTVYGEQNIQTDPRPQQSTPKKPLFDLASIKPKTVSQEDSTSEDPFMDLFMRKPRSNIANVPSNNNSLEYTSTYL